MKNILGAALSLMISATISAQTLNPGDIVVIGYAADTGTATMTFSEFSWVPLVNLAAGTKIYFTDAGYNTVDANFMGSGLNDEILLKYVVPAGGIPGGTVFTVTEQSLPADYTVITGTKFGNDFNGLLSFPNAGDQITVFQSSDDENIPATFGNTSFNAIFMVTGSSLSFTALTSSTAGVTPTFNLDNVTNLAPGLTNAVNAVAVGTGPLEADESDNARYIGTTSGTREEILFAVSQASNWSRHDTAFGNDLAFGTTPNGWSANHTELFAIDGLGVPSEGKEFSKISLYPNPAAGQFSIRNESGQDFKAVTILNASGQAVQKCDPKQNLIDVSSLAAGLYLVEIALENATVVKKLIRY